MTFYCVDVETDGPLPGVHSMLSIGVVAVRNDLGDRFYAELRPVTSTSVPQALAISGLDREALVSDGEDPGSAMRRLRTFLESTSKGRPVFVGDNPAFDFPWVNHYFHIYDAEGRERPNPFGHSARRLGDLWAGLAGDASKSSEWKDFRTTAHTHNALDDALGNAEALIEMKRRGLKIGLK